VVQISTPTLPTQIEFGMVAFLLAMAPARFTKLESFDEIGKV